MTMDLRKAIRVLNALPADRRSMLVVRSLPFGDIIEDDSGKVHIKAPVDCQFWAKKRWAYRVCLLGKLPPRAMIPRPFRPGFTP